MYGNLHRFAHGTISSVISTMTLSSVVVPAVSIAESALAPPPPPPFDDDDDDDEKNR